MVGTVFNVGRGVGTRRARGKVCGGAKSRIEGVVSVSTPPKRRLATQRFGRGAIVPEIARGGEFDAPWI